MLRHDFDPVTAETHPRQLRVASIYRRFNRTGSIESLYLRNTERLAQDECDRFHVCRSYLRLPNSCDQSVAPLESWKASPGS